MTEEEIIQLAIDVAEKSGCDVSAMDGREYESIWCERQAFEKFIIDFVSELISIGV